MDFSFTEEELAWRAEVRDFVRKWIGTDILHAQAERHGLDGGYTDTEKEYYADLGARGWNSLHWPVEYGGESAPVMRNLILLRELEYALLPQIDWSVASIGPLIYRTGTEENKAEWLEKVRRAEVTFAFGYSEPDAGTDLASLKARAELDGDDWVINGQKIWNSAAHWATHEFVAVRTDPNEPGHRGISTIIVPIDAPGIEIQPLYGWGSHRTSLVFFNDVRVPRSNLIGEVNQGWKGIASSLDHERADIGARVVGSLTRLLDDLIAYCDATVVDGEALSHQPDVSFRLAELEMELEIATLMNYEVASIMESGNVPTIPGTMQKIFASELRPRIAILGMDVAEGAGQLDAHDPLAAAGGNIEHEYRWAPVQRFGGGTNEVLRDIIAQRGLGLPRANR